MTDPAQTKKRKFTFQDVMLEEITEELNEAKVELQNQLGAVKSAAEANMQKMNQTSTAYENSVKKKEKELDDMIAKKFKETETKVNNLLTGINNRMTTIEEKSKLMTDDINAKGKELENLNNLIQDARNRLNSLEIKAGKIESTLKNIKNAIKD
jgi:deoxyribodipyrimidine photolyase